MGYLVDSFTGQEDPTNSIKVLKGKRYKVRKKNRKRKQHKIQQHNKETHTETQQVPSLH